MKTTLSTIHRALTTFIALGVFVQMLLAGLWHASVFDTPEAHVFFGLAMLLAALIALIAAAVARMPRAVLTSTAIVFVLMLLQPILIELRRDGGIPVLSALHTLNAAFIGMTSGAAMRAGRAVAAAGGQVQPVAGD